jgi:hypothetical protein
LKKNRAWIFVAYQGTQIRQESVLISAVPTAAMRSGAFPNAIFDPNTTVPAPTGGGFIRTPFPNNTIPASAINPVGQMLVQLYPAPNLSGLGNNYVRNAPNSTSLDNAHSFRGDLQLSAKDSLFARFSFQSWNHQRGGRLPRSGRHARSTSTFLPGTSASDTRASSDPRQMNFACLEPARHR